MNNIKDRNKTEIEFKRNYQDNRNQFIRILDFVKKNQNLKKDIELHFNSKLFLPSINVLNRLHYLFIDCINASRASNLTITGESCKEFWELISSLEIKNHKIEYSEFLKILSVHNKLDDESLFIQIKMLKNFGNKKAALFINKLFWLQNSVDAEYKIFHNFNLSKKDLEIPIDNVIIKILNEVFYSNTEIKLDQNKHFLIINNFFKQELEKDFLLIEDLWFWGYFCTKGNGEDREIAFNPAKFYSSDFIEPKLEYIALFHEFINLVKSK